MNRDKYLMIISVFEIFLIVAAFTVSMDAAIAEERSFLKCSDEKVFPKPIMPLTKEEMTAIHSDKREVVFSQRIHKDLPVYEFKIIRNEKRSPHVLEIRNLGDNKPFQKIKNKYLNYVALEEREDSIQMTDLNFDGYLDLKLHRSSGATGNVWYLTFLYDVEKGVYRFNSPLSSLSSIQALPSLKVVSNWFRFGSFTEIMGFYRVNKNDVRLIQVVWTEMGSYDDDKKTRSEDTRYVGIPKRRDAWLNDNAIGYGYSYIRKQVLIIDKRRADEYSLWDDKDFYDPRRGYRDSRRRMGLQPFIGKQVQDEN